jgi:Flp pilus assembly protein TadD
MKRVDAAASLFLAVGLVSLAGCGDIPFQGDPFAITQRDAELNIDKHPVDYAALMRIAAAAHGAGDHSTAVSVYRRAASVETRLPAPFVALGNTLLEMGNANEAILAYNAALRRAEHDADGLRGLARAYLMGGKPELAGQPLALAFHDTPDDPKLLQLIGVADDFVGQHEEAQARYRRGLELLPGDPALSLNLALSLALVGNYPEAIGVLRPIANATNSSARERQTLALIYGLAGDRGAAERLSRRDLDPEAVARNLAYYDSLRRMSPEARTQALQALGAHTSPTAGQPS